MAAIRALVVATSGMACAPKAIPDEQSAPPPDCPADMRRVEGGGGVASFCFDTYEVTVAAYASCVTAGVCTAPIVGDGHGCNHLFGSTGEPINCVESTQAERYCRWRGKRLPDDAEWLWAAHGGARATVYPWGDSSVRVCFDRAKPRGTCQVGSFEDASPEGLHDLVGNVAEWTIKDGRAGLRGGSSRELANLGPDARRSEETSPQSGFRCAAAPGSSIREIPAALGARRYWRPPEEEAVVVGLPALIPVAPVRPIEHLDVIDVSLASARRWTELGDGSFVPFAPADPRLYGLLNTLDGSSAPAGGAACEPIRGLLSVIVFLCRDRSELVAVDRVDGSIDWQIPYRGGDSEGLYFGPSQFIVVIRDDTGAAEVTGISLGTGRPQWGRSIEREDEIWHDGSGLYLWHWSTVTAIDPGTGAGKWQIDGGCGPVRSDEFVVEDARGFHRLDPRTGKALATIGAPRPACGSTPVLAGGRRFDHAYSSAHERLLRAADLPTGRALWQHTLANFASLAIDDDAVYITDGEELRVLDPVTGELRVAFTVGRVLDPPRLVEAGGAFGPLLVLSGGTHNVVVGRAAAPVQLVDYAIRGRIAGTPERHHQVFMLGPHAVPLDAGGAFAVAGRRAIGTRLELQSPDYTFRPGEVVLDARRTHDLGGVRIRPRKR